MRVSAAGLAACFATIALAAPAIAQEAPPPPPSAPAAAPNGWTPLDFNRFGPELTEKWIPVPNGDSGAPRQGWLNTADGFFTREAHVAYDYVDTGAGRADRQGVLLRFNHPLSRRLWAGVEIPVVQNINGSDSFGDHGLNTLVMLAETKNLSINAGVGWRLPTGEARFGNNVFAAQPQINFWGDVGSGFALRGRLGYEIADNGSPDNFVLNAAIGQTVTPHNPAPFGDLTWYVSGNYRQQVSGPGRSFFSITPGMRTHVGNNLFLLLGVEFPITEPRESFNQRYIVQLVQGF